MKIFTFDTTLRDGTQGESISFSVDDKLIIAQKLDELGIDYIEGGWPGSNPKDREFFERARQLELRHARLTAFGSTRFARNRVEEDRNVRALAEAGTPAVSIFGKTWDLHVERALGISLDQNLQLISETVQCLKDHGKEVVYDAELIQFLGDDQFVIHGEGDGFALRAVAESGIERKNLHSYQLSAISYQLSASTVLLRADS